MSHLPLVPPVPLKFKPAFEKFLQQWMLQEVITHTHADPVTNVHRAIAHLTKCYVERTDDKQRYHIVICLPPELKNNSDPYDMGFADIARLIRVTLKSGDPKATAEYMQNAQKIIVQCRDLKSFAQAFDVLVPIGEAFPAGDYFPATGRGR